MRRFFVSVFFLAVPLALAGAQTPDSTAPVLPGKSALQGVFTESQATRGDSEHQTNCVSCHSTTNYAGDAFAKAWIGRTAFDLFEQLRTTMPDDSPGSLSQQQYVDIVAYILKINGYPAGTDSLSTDPEALRLVRLEAKKDSHTTFAPRASRTVSASLLRSAGLRPAGLYHPHAVIAPTASR
jgi:S-disulfanyl-L-cysteine oxidoreductase SoxD